jgi:hypothetical protein
MICTIDWIWKSMTKSVLLCLLKTSSKLQQKSMFYGSVIKQQIQSIIFNTKIYNFSTKYLYMYPYSQNVCLWMSSIFPKLPFLGSPQDHQHEQQKQNSTRIQNSNPQLSNGLILFVMPYKPQKLCNLPTPLTLLPLHSRFCPRNPCGIIEKWNVVII